MTTTQRQARAKANIERYILAQREIDSAERPRLPSSTNRTLPISLVDVAAEEAALADKLERFDV